MKKQILILATAFMTVAFISCSKESIETQQTNKSNELAEAPGSINQGQGNIYIDPLIIGLQGRFEFNGSLKDKTGKLVDAVPSVNGATSYTTDRKGEANKAIQFTGAYGVNILSVPYTTKMSVAAWVKYSSGIVPTIYFVQPELIGPQLGQSFNKYFGGISTPATTSVLSGVMDNKWHHLVAIFDGTLLKFYVDGQLAGSVLNKSPLGNGLTKYRVAFNPFINAFWQGSMDDLCFYNRTLSATDVQKLYKL